MGTEHGDAGFRCVGVEELLVSGVEVGGEGVECWFW